MRTFKNDDEYRAWLATASDDEITQDISDVLSVIDMGETIDMGENVERGAN